MRLWVAAIWSALPMVICLVVADVLLNGPSKVTIVFALIACLVVWIPLAISRIVLRMMSWSSPKAHLRAMFAITFVPMLGVYKFYEFDPDASFSYQVNEGGRHFIEFSVTGVVISLIAGLINVLCMWVFLRVARRYSEGSSATL